ncbi:MAG: hypothetical protein BWY76_02688 [bacterium ADurb.Bin429]|nr:MAG: hypothetical protein BWY76_02688 [bacterium ADurb.Bin429]
MWSIRGLWYDQYGLDRALARVGGCVERSSWVQGNWIRWYSPDSYDELMRYHLAIVANTNGNAFANGGHPAPARTRLKDFAAHGGAVLFLGGLFAYGREYHGTALEEMSPVTFADKRDLEMHPGGLPLAAGPDAPAGIAKLNWQEAPRVYWTHAVTPKPGAKVLLTADGKPLLVTWLYGKGRVAVFAGTVMGDPKAGQLPFWQWGGWPAVMAETLSWLTVNPERPGGANRADYAKTLNAALRKAGGKEGDERAVMKTYLRCCADSTAAEALTDALASLFWDISLDETDAYYATVLPHVRGEFVGVADALLESGKTHKTMLGLRLLGLAKAPGAKERLLDALKRGEVDIEEVGDSLEPGTAGEDADYRAYAYRLAALEGLGNLGDPSVLPAIRAVVKQYEAKRPRRADFPKDVTREHELYQAALQAALRCGDAAAAGPLLDMLMQNRYTLVNMMFAAFADGKGAQAQAQREKAQRAYTRLQARQALACARLAPLPAPVLPALAKRLAAEDDLWVTPFAFAAFGKGFGAKPSAEALAILTGAKVPAVAELAAAR